MVVVEIAGTVYFSALLSGRIIQKPGEVVGISHMKSYLSPILWVVLLVFQVG